MRMLRNWSALRTHCSTCRSHTLVGIFTFSLACADVSHAVPVRLQHDNAVDVYEQIANKIPEAGVQIEQGYVFAAETARCEGGGESAIGLASARARVGAMRRLLPLVLDTANGRPATIAPRVAELLNQSASVQILNRIQVSGLQLVSQVERGQQIRIVLAVPEGQLPREKIGWVKAVEALRSSPAGLVDLAVLAEISANEAQDSKAALAEFDQSVLRRWSHPSGEDPSRVLSGRIGVGWLDAPIVSAAGDLADLPIAELEQRVDLRSGDPQLLGELARRLEALELHVASQAVRLWPRVKIDPTASIPEGVARALAGSDGLGGAESSDRATEVRERRVRVVHVLLSTAGSWPIDSDMEASPEAKQLFAGNQLNAALARLIDDCQANPSADALSLASACLFNLREFADAGRIAELAFAARPSHPYAGVNLARSLFAMGRVDEARELARKLKNLVKLDDWGRDRIADLISPPPPVAQQPESDQATSPEEDSALQPPPGKAAPRGLEGDFHVEPEVQSAIDGLPKSGSGMRVASKLGALSLVSVGQGSCTTSDDLGAIRSSADCEILARVSAVTDAKAEIARFVQSDISSYFRTESNGEGRVASLNFTQSRVKRQLVAGLREWRAEVRWEGDVCFARVWLVSDAVGELDSKGFVNGVPCFESAQGAAKEIVRRASRGLCRTGVIWVYVGSDASRQLVPVAIAAAPAGADRELLSMSLQADLGEAFRTTISQIRTLGECSNYDPLSPEGAQWVFKEFYSSATDAYEGSPVGYFRGSGLYDEIHGGQRYAAIVGARAARRE
jgi:tetratricopeptide (TPR) repeat protein